MFLMSEAPLYRGTWLIRTHVACINLDTRRATKGLSGAKAVALQEYLTDKKTQPPRTLP
jgi:hypothetical protein